MNDHPEFSPSPMVSVVMIAYNKEKYIGRAIKGVVDQVTDFSVELIVMDDCSTDSTPQIIQQYADRYPDIVHHFRNQSNLGLQRNYLEGFKHCRGRYMAICDADDYWCYRHKLSKQVRYMEDHPECALTFHRVINYYENTREKSLSNGNVPAEFSLASLSRSNYITNLSVLYRRELLDLTNLPAWIKDDRSPDYAMHILYAAQGSIHYFPRPMGVYRKSSEGAWSMTDEFERLKMSLSVRLYLIQELRHRPEAVEGLRAAAVSILASMKHLAITYQQRKTVDSLAAEAQLDKDLSEAPAPKPIQKSLLSRLVRYASRFIPVP